MVECISPRLLPMCQNLFIYSFIVDDAIIFSYDVIYQFSGVRGQKRVLTWNIWEGEKFFLWPLSVSEGVSPCRKGNFKNFYFSKTSNFMTLQYIFDIGQNSGFFQHEFITLRKGRPDMSAMYTMYVH